MGADSEHDSRETALEYLKELSEAKAKDLETRLLQQSDEHRLQADMLKDLLAAERQRREDALQGLRDDHDAHQRAARERAERLESESREFFGKMEGFLEAETRRVSEDVELFRKQLMAESEKVAELVRREIEARFSSDVWGDQRAQKPGVDHILVGVGRAVRAQEGF